SATTATNSAGTPFGYTLAATGAPAPTLTFTNLPAGIAANGATLSGSIASNGQYSVGLHATNIFGSDDRTLVISVGVKPAISSPLGAASVVNASFSYTL